MCVTESSELSWSQLCLIVKGCQESSPGDSRFKKVTLEMLSRRPSGEKAQQWVPISRESDSIWMNACKVRERSDIWLWLASAVTEKNVSPYKDAVLASALDARRCSPTTTGLLWSCGVERCSSQRLQQKLYLKREHCIQLNIENKTHTSRRSERPSLMRFTFHVVRSLEHPEEP